MEHTYFSMVGDVVWCISAIRSCVCKFWNSQCSCMGGLVSAVALSCGAWWRHLYHRGILQGTSLVLVDCVASAGPEFLTSCLTVCSVLLDLERHSPGGLETNDRTLSWTSASKWVRDFFFSFHNFWDQLHCAYAYTCTHTHRETHTHLVGMEKDWSMHSKLFPRRREFWCPVAQGDDYKQNIILDLSKQKWQI